MTFSCDVFVLSFWGAVLLNVVLLYRAFRGRFLSKYPFFYAYLGFVFADRVFMRAIRSLRPELYRSLEWPMGFVTMFLACGILLDLSRSIVPHEQRADNLTRLTWLVFYGVMFCFATVYVRTAILVGCVIVAEILRYVLTPRENLEKFLRVFRVAIAGAVFGGVVASLALPPRGEKAVFLARVALERDFRVVQVALVLAILAVLFYRGIPLGKNGRGRVLAYGLYAITVLVMDSLRLYLGHPPFELWLNVQPIAYEICVVVWLASLWNYHPNPPSAVLASMYADTDLAYEGITAHALRALDALATSAIARAHRTCIGMPAWRTRSKHEPWQASLGHAKITYGD